MRTIRCRQLRPVLTSYVDHEVSASERLIVEGHLGRCDACRRRVSREGAVRERLRRWSVEAHSDGAPLSWPADSGTLGHRSTRTLPGIAALSTATIAIVFIVWSGWRGDGAVALTARGRIGDSLCAGGHVHAAPELQILSERDCVRRCVEMGASYVFVSQGTVYAIRNQDLVDLTPLAGQDVEIVGELRQNLLTVSSVRQTTVGRSNHEGFSKRVRVS